MRVLLAGLLLGLISAQLGSSKAVAGKRRQCFGGRIWTKCAVIDKCRPSCAARQFSERQCPAGKSNQLASDGSCAGACVCPPRFPLWHDKFNICVSAEFCEETTVRCELTSCKVMEGKLVNAMQDE